MDNFSHADMHPGNFLVRVSQSKASRKRFFKSKPHVIFLDVGMTAELSKSDHVNLLEFLRQLPEETAALLQSVHSDYRSDKTGRTQRLLLR